MFNIDEIDTRTEIKRENKQKVEVTWGVKKIKLASFLSQHVDAIL
jgi:hypothetical protein